jgi:hypothetical protein
LTTLNGFTAAEYVTTIGVVTATFVIPFAGLTLTVGPVLTGVGELEVVKLLVNPLTVLPARSVKPPTVTV